MHSPVNVKLGFIYFTLVFLGSTAPSGPGTPRCRGFTITHNHTTLDRTTQNHSTLDRTTHNHTTLDRITHNHTTLDRTTPDEWSVRCRDLYLTTHNTLKK